MPEIDKIVKIQAIIYILQVPQPKLMMLLAAKWREFQVTAATMNDPDQTQDSVATTEADQAEEEDATPKRGRGRRSRSTKKMVDDEVYDFDNEK